MTIAIDGREEGSAEEDSGDTELSPQAVRLLGTMGTRGGWHSDALCAATGMSYGDVSGALLTLVLAGCVEETFSRYRALTGALP
ncbi:MAG: hypothetical protein DRI90_08620 [Deltaproteobacteria bacterium]|nr:MAG: hypothetical protein DRI90_08620 [Deltaproteobacteria bacterium]